MKLTIALCLFVFTSLSFAGTNQLRCMIYDSISGTEQTVFEKSVDIAPGEFSSAEAIVQTSYASYDFTVVSNDQRISVLTAAKNGQLFSSVAENRINVTLNSKERISSIELECAISKN